LAFLILNTPWVASVSVMKPTSGIRAAYLFKEIPKSCGLFESPFSFLLHPAFLPWPACEMAALFTAFTPYGGSCPAINLSTFTSFLCKI
jgi:hypothetical protein